MSTPQPEPPFAATRKALAEALAQIDGLLPGSVVVRRRAAAKATVPARQTHRPCTGPTPSGPALCAARPSPRS